VQGVGKRVVDRLNVGVGEDVGVGAECSLNSALLSEVLGATARSVAATATSRWPVTRAGLTMARSAIRAAPSTPMRIGAVIAVPVMRLVLPGQSAARSSSD
jgi:hypothetical protein